MGPGLSSGHRSRSSASPGAPPTMETDAPSQSAPSPQQDSPPQPPASSSSPSPSSPAAPSTSQAPQGSGGQTGGSSGQSSQNAPVPNPTPAPQPLEPYNWPFSQPHVYIQDGGYFLRQSYEMYVSSEVPLKATQMLNLMNQRMLARERQLWPHDTILTRNINVLPLEPMADSEDEELLEGHEPPKRKRNPRLQIPHAYSSGMTTAQFYYRNLRKCCFVETQAHHRALDILIQNRCILILGHNGDGKTTFGLWLLKKLSQQLDADGLYMHGVEDYAKAYSYPMRDPRITMMDNIFGSGYYAESEMKKKEWEDFEECYTGRFDYGQYMIFTSTIFHYQQHFEEVSHYPMMSSVPVFDLSKEENSFSFPQMQEILKKQCLDNGKADVSPELARDVPRLGFPGRVNHFVTRKEAFEKGMSHWSLHLEPYVTMLISLSNGDTVYFSILVFMVTNCDQLDPEDFTHLKKWSTTDEELKKKKQQIREDKGWYSRFWGEKYEKWPKCLEHMKGVLVTYDETAKVWRIISDMVRLAIFMVWGGRHYYSNFLKFVGRRFLVDHTYMDTREGERRYTVFRHHIRYDLWRGKALMERLIQEMLDGHVAEMLLHRNFLEEDFIHGFLVKLRDMDRVQEFLFVRNKEDDDIEAEPLLVTNINAREEGLKDQAKRQKKEEEEKRIKEGKGPSETLAQKNERRKKEMEKRMKEDKKSGKGRRILTVATSLELSHLVQAILLMPEIKTQAKQDWFQEDLAQAAALAENLDIPYLKTMLRSFLPRPREATMEVDPAQS